MVAGGAVLLLTALTAAGIILAGNSKRADTDVTEDKSQAYSGESGSSREPESEDAADPRLGGLVDCGTPQYNYTGLNLLDLSLRNHTPNSKQEGMDWDSTLFYSLEDIDSNSSEDNRIADCLVSDHEFINALSGSLIRCIAYADPDSMQIHKIVTVEQQDGEYVVSDYYYDGGKVNFVFSRRVDVYTPTYATIEKTGLRYYFNDDVMVRFRRIDVPKMIVQQTLKPAETWYSNTSYFEMGEAERAEYDAMEYQVLNEAYNVYDAIAGRTGIIDLTGHICSAEGKPLENVSVALIENTGGTVFYSALSAQDGSYHLYVSPDYADCYMQVYLEGYAPVYIHDIKLDSGLMGNITSDITLSDMEAASVNGRFCLYDSLALTSAEDAKALEGAKVVIREGLNVTGGECVAEGITDETGFFEAFIPQGAYTAEYSLDGYSTTYESFYMTAVRETVSAYTVPAITDKTEKIVLVWEAETEPALDLDLVVFTPEKSAYGDMCYISAGHPMDHYNNYLAADAVDSRCEVVSLSNELRGVYKVFVNDYTGYQDGDYASGALAGSRARVYIFSAGGLTAVYYVDSGTPGIVWDVCERRNGYSPNSTMFFSLDDYPVIAKERVGKEAILECYRQFLLGNLTADYEGRQVTFDEFYEIYCDEMGFTDEMYADPSPINSFALTDHDMDNLPELQLQPQVGASWDWAVYMVEPMEGSLKITKGIEGGYMDSFTMYTNGLARIDHGMSATAASGMFVDWQGETRAVFMYYYEDFMGETMDSAIAESYEQLLREGYQYVYVTGGNYEDSAWDAYERRRSDFENEYCGGIVYFHEINEESVRANLVWD